MGRPKLLAALALAVGVALATTAAHGSRSGGFCDAAVDHDFERSEVAKLHLSRDLDAQ